MASEPQDVVREMFEALDRMDIDRIEQTIGEEAQAVDEISKDWLRSRDQITGYLRKLTGAVSDVRSTLRDVRQQTWDGTAVITCWLEQDYSMDGQQQHVSAPTTAVLRQVGNDWQIVLFHSIPVA